MAVHFDLGLRAYDVADLQGVKRHRAAVGMLPGYGARSLEFLALRWRELWLLERPDDALAVAREAADRYREDPDAALELADVLVEVGQGSEALAVLQQAARDHGDEPDIWYEVGVAAERLERWDLRTDAFTRVWELEHHREPAFRLWLPEERFIAVAERAIGRLPPVARRSLGNVSIHVEDYPERWILETEVADPRLLGLFDGPERATELGVDHVSYGPALIHLFRWNIERVCASEEEVEEQVEITVRHEIGHYLGLDEDALDFMGLG